MIKIKKIRKNRKFRDDHWTRELEIEVNNKVVTADLLNIAKDLLQMVYRSYSNYVDRAGKESYLKDSKMEKIAFVSTPTLKIVDLYGDYDKKALPKETEKPKDKYQENLEFMKQAKENREKSSDNDDEYDNMFTDSKVNDVEYLSKLEEARHPMQRTSETGLTSSYFGYEDKTYSLRIRCRADITNKYFVDIADTVSPQDHLNDVDLETLNWFKTSYENKTKTEEKDGEVITYSLTEYFSNPDVKSEIKEDKTIETEVFFDCYVKAATGTDEEKAYREKKRHDRFDEENKKLMEKNNENLAEKEKLGTPLEEGEGYSNIPENYAKPLQYKPYQYCEKIIDLIKNKIDGNDKSSSGYKKLFPEFNSQNLAFKERLRDYLKKPSEATFNNASKAFVTLMNGIINGYARYKGNPIKSFEIITVPFVQKAADQFKDLYGLETLYDEEGNLTYNPETDLA